jgi:hypothetical protein
MARPFLRAICTMEDHMPKYSVVIEKKTTMTATVEVEAEYEEDAFAKVLAMAEAGGGAGGPLDWDLEEETFESLETLEVPDLEEDLDLDDEADEPL